MKHLSLLFFICAQFAFSQQPFPKVEIDHKLPDGTNFTDKKDLFKKSLLLGAGKDIANEPLLGFYDLPACNIESYEKSTLWFVLEDRNDKARFRVITKTGGSTLFNIFDKDQKGVFSIYSPGDKYTFLSMRQPDSYINIGGFKEWNNWDRAYKLNVYDGGANIEGDIISGGNIGIGTKIFEDGEQTYRLSVNGQIRAHGIRVYNSWADYVFKENYNLPSLEEVEQHIKEKGHLKDIPSAKEVAENGIELGEMNKLLLQKIEELTLYTIQLKKEIEILKKQVK